MQEQLKSIILTMLTEKNIENLLQSEIITFWLTRAYTNKKVYFEFYLMTRCKNGPGQYGMAVAILFIIENACKSV